MTTTVQLVTTGADNRPDCRVRTAPRDLARGKAGHEWDNLRLTEGALRIACLSAYIRHPLTVANGTSVACRRQASLDMTSDFCKRARLTNPTRG